jgi:coenzyme F420-reducing hydrogenase beta subunit
MIKNSINEIISKDLCTGCTSCALICPKKAISIPENEDGFLSSKIDDKKCTNCGLCKQVCPVLSNYNKPKEIYCFSGWSVDNENLLKSSSGGIFFELAKEMLSKGGYVVGAVMDGKRPTHLISNNLKELEKMRSSKYIQSNYSKLVDKIIDISKTKQILFVGVPCQVHGLKNLLKIKKAKLDNIIFVDLICHGMPSYLIFDKYLDSLNIKDKFIINFREKSLGWENYSLIINTKDKDIKVLNRENKFMQSFISDLSLRTSCYNCKFLCNSQADITLGDFWGVPKEIKNEKGTSAIIINTTKGENLINSLISSKKIIVNKTTFTQIVKGNPKLLNGITRKPKNREKFLDYLRINDFNKTYIKFVKPNFYKRMKNLAYYTLCRFKLI